MSGRPLASGRRPDDAISHPAPDLLMHRIAGESAGSGRDTPGRRGFCHAARPAGEDDVLSGQPSVMHREEVVRLGH